MSDNIRVGLIGYGYASKTFHAPLIAGTPGLELAVISSSDETKVKADWPTVTVVSEPKHLFNDPNIDLIVIPTPNDTHFPLAKAALEAGKHVVVDKPFTVTLSQARELEALAKSLGRVLSVFHNRRWDSDFLTLKVCSRKACWVKLLTLSPILTASARRCAIVGVNRAARQRYLVRFSTAPS